jgi:hypothetical protein
LEGKNQAVFGGDRASLTGFLMKIVGRWKIPESFAYL